MSKIWTKYQEKLLSENTYNEWRKNSRSPLPLRIVTEEDLAEPYIQAIEHIIKRHASNIITGTATDFREEIRKFIKQVQQESYARGVKTANKIIEL